MQSIQSYIKANKDRFLGELIELLKIPSISADSAYKGDVLKTAEVIKTSLENAGFKSAFDTPFFNEFVLKAPVGFEQKRTALINEKCIFAGVELEPFYPEFKQHYLFCATEKISKADIDQLAKEVQ